MGTVNKLDAAARLLDPSNANLDGQSRVNAEIFTAMEILGRKLERAEAERDRLVRRLALIESSATVDEKTGKLYLPALMNQDLAPRKEYATPKWMVAASLMSSAIALFALGLVLFREPAPALTKEQLAILDSLRGTQFTQLASESKGWKNLAADTQENPALAAGDVEKTPVAAAQADASAVPPDATATQPPAAQLASAPTAQSAPAPAASAPAPAAQSAGVPVAQTPAPPAPQPPVAVVAQMPAPAATTAQAPVPPPVVTASPAPAAAQVAQAQPTAEPPKPAQPPVMEPPVTAATQPPSTAPPPLTPADKTDTADASKTDPTSILIPGEDDIPPQGTKKTTEAPRTGSKDKAATVVPTTETAGGITPDAALPKKLVQLQKRAYQGVPEAQHDLATLYAAGSLVPQDYKRAAFWFTKAAEGGVANAHYNMGVIYHQGLGVPVDLAKALGWYEKAAELGHPEAMYNLGIAYIEGIGTKTDIPKGVSYFKRAAKAGVVQAAYNLGVLYESNFIGPIDTKKAIAWYRVAAKQGHQQARDALTRLQGGDAVAADSTGDQALTLADKVEPAAGGDEETGEGDSSPVSETPSHSAPKTILADIQRILIKQGLLPGQVDGVLNQQTEDVIRATQKKLGMTQDGQPSQELLEKLLQAPPATNQPAVNQ